MKLTLLLALAAPALAIASPCERATTSGDILARSGRVRSAFADQDPIALAAASDETTRALECVVEPLDAGQVQALHFVRGLWAITALDETAAIPYLAAARPRGGDGAMGLALGDREQETVERLAPELDRFETSAGARVPLPLRGRVVLDGRLEARRVPGNAPYVLQRVAGGRVLDSRYVLPGEALPRYRRLRPALSATGLSLVAASAGLFVGGALSHQRLYARHDPLLSQAEVDALQKTNHGLLLGAAASGTAALLTFGTLGASYLW